MISESIDGEVVIIALATGTYYSLRGTAARAWDGLAAGLDTPAVVADLERCFRSDPADAPVDVPGAVDAFIAALIADGLLATADDDPIAPPASLAPPPGAPLLWEPMVVETFTDMQELILLDPVHEVEPGQGWPVAIENPDR